MGKVYIDIFPKKIYKCPKLTHEKKLNIISHQMPIKTTMRYYVTPTKIAIFSIKKEKNVRMWKNWNPQTLLVRI